MQSQWYQITAAVVATVQGVCTAQGVGFLDNPALPIDASAAGGRALLVIHRGDKLLDQPGQQPERRSLRLVLGAVSVTAAAPMADADALHFAARDALKSRAFRLALRAVGDITDVREIEVEPELRDMAVQGAVLLSAYQIDYFQSYPSFNA